MIIILRINKVHYIITNTMNNTQSNMLLNISTKLKNTKCQLSIAQLPREIRNDLNFRQCVKPPPSKDMEGINHY